MPSSRSVCVLSHLPFQIDMGAENHDKDIFFFLYYEKDHPFILFCYLMLIKIF